MMITRFLTTAVIALCVCTCAWGQTSEMARVESRLMPGRLALEDGFAALAEKVFTECLQEGGLSDTDVSEANIYLLQALLDQGKHDAMRAKLDALASQQVLSEDAVTYLRAMSLHAQLQYAQAAELLAAFGETWPKSRWRVAAMRLLGLARLKSGDVAGATSTFAAFASEYPDADERYVNRLDWGKALVFQGDLNAAVKVLSPVMQDEAAGTLSHEARYWVGKAYLQLKDVEAGQRVLAPLVSNSVVGESLRVKVALAVSEVFADASNFDAAIKLLEESVAEVRGDDAKQDLSLALCNVLLSADRLEAVIPLVKIYVSSHADSASASALQMRLGNALLDAGRHEEAIVIYQQYLETFSDTGGQARARMGHGWALMGAERYAEAAVAFEKAYALFTDPEQRMTSLCKVADARFLNAQYQQALTLYERFVSEYPKSPTDAEVRFQMGICLASLGQHEDAERMFEAVAKTYAGSSVADEAIFQIGEQHYAMKDWKSAAAAFERVMERGEKGEFFVEALHGRGLSRYQLWSPDALMDFERIVRDYPASSMGEHSLYMQAMCLYRLGRDALALGVCRTFLERYAQSTWVPSVRFWIGRFAYNTGDYAVAETEFLSFAEQFPDHKFANRAIYRAGMSAVKRKEYVRGIELFGQLAKLYPTGDRLSDARFHQADAMSQLGKFAAAILVFEEVINNYPESALIPLAWGRKGDCQFTLGAEDASRYEEAIRSYRVVTQSPLARQDHMWQAEYKIGRCLEKLGREEDAQDQYYTKVMVPFLLAKSRGEAISESAKTWFTRASLGAADIVTKHKDWRKLVRLLDRIAEAEVAVSEEARTRMKAIKAENWWLFY